MWNIARKEIVSNLISYKFFVVIILTIVLVFTSFFIMYRDYKEWLADYQIIKPSLYVYGGDMLRHNQARVLQRMSCQLVRLG